MKGYGTGFRNAVIGSVIVLIVTGLLLAPTTLNMRLEVDMPWQLASSQRIAVVALHVGISYLVLMLIGALWVIHMRGGWRLRRNHISGIVMVVILIGLTITGIGIFYLGDESYTIIASASHLVLGLLIPVFFLYHMLFGRRRFRS